MLPHMEPSQDSGFLLIDKPAGWTSFDVVAKLRTITGIKKIGHAGTLDPFATGLLIIAIGRSATKHIDHFMKLPKTYEATFVFGATTQTLDPETSPEPATITTPLTETTIDSAMNSMLGDSLQTPPMHSAIKVNGQRLYALARQGKTTERPERPINISHFKRTGPVTQTPVTESLTLPTISATITVSSGTYVRVLAQDLAQNLGTQGYLLTLRRLTIGPHTVKKAHTISEITRENWRTLVNMLI